MPAKPGKSGNSCLLNENGDIKNLYKQEYSFALVFFLKFYKGYNQPPPAGMTPNSLVCQNLSTPIIHPLFANPSSPQQSTIAFPDIVYPIVISSSIPPGN